MYKWWSKRYIKKVNENKTTTKKIGKKFKKKSFKFFTQMKGLGLD
jgi:hypothetical protein